MTDRGSSVRHRTDVATLLVALLGAAPGLVLPFAIALVYPHESSDLFLLAVSIAVTATALGGAAIEVNSVSEVGRLLAHGTHAETRSLRRFRLRSLGYGALIAAVVVPVLLAIYAWRLDDPAGFILLVAVLGLGPVVGGYASAVSGEAIALGRTYWVVCLQASRALLPLLVLVVAGSAVPLLALAVAYVAGEIVRAAVLTAVCARAVARDEHSRIPADLAIRGLGWQSSATAIAHSQPVVDRTILAGGSAGSISAYEMADRVMQAGAQLVMMGILQRRVGRWSRIRAMTRSEVARMLRADAITAGVWSIAAAVGVAGVCLTALALRIVPEEWTLGLTWGAILAASIPTLLVTTAGSRLLVIADRQRILIWFAVGSALATLVADLVLFALLGPVGVIIAAVVVRALLATAHVLVLRAVLPPVTGSEAVET